MSGWGGVLAALAVAVVSCAIAALWYVASQSGDNIERHKAACYALPGEHHYWQDRDVCVVYVKAWSS